MINDRAFRKMYDLYFYKAWPIYSKTWHRYQSLVNLVLILRKVQVYSKGGQSLKSIKFQEFSRRKYIEA